MILDDTFNKSVCLDLESQLIMLFSGDGKFEVINSNAGIADYDYFDRAEYQLTFDQIVENLRVLGLFDQSALDIRNSNLFKYSPYKALNEDQVQVTEAIIDACGGRLKKTNLQSTLFKEAQEPGNHRRIFLTKLLSDLGSREQHPEGESVFDDYYLRRIPRAFP